MTSNSASQSSRPGHPDDRKAAHRRHPRTLGLAAAAVGQGRGLVRAAVRHDADTCRTQVLRPSNQARTSLRLMRHSSPSPAATSSLKSAAGFRARVPEGDPGLGPQAHLTRVSALMAGPGRQDPYPGGYAAPPQGGCGIRCRFPVAFRRPGVSFSRHPVPAAELSLPCSRPTRRYSPGPQRGYHVSQV